MSNGCKKCGSDWRCVEFDRKAKGYRLYCVTCGSNLWFDRHGKRYVAPDWVPEQELEQIDHVAEYSREQVVRYGRERRRLAAA